MLRSELRAQVRHLFYAEHWKVGTIARQLGVHPDTVRHVLETKQFNRTSPSYGCAVFPESRDKSIRRTLAKSPSAEPAGACPAF